MPSLKVTPIPFRPSNLSIPPSPLSPLSPLTPKTCTPYKPQSRLIRRASVSPVAPPPSPLKWLWQCHSCHSAYPLGATRRCLEDGHFFCAGTTVVRSKKKGGSGSKKVLKRHKACASEFDYQAWSAWGDWRRVAFEVAPEFESENGEKDCWRNCNYPSECRWGAQTAGPSPATPPATTFESILQKRTEKESKKKKEEAATAATKAPKEDFWSILLASTTRRKTTKSPLVLSTVVEDEEGNVEMTDVDMVAAVTEPEPSLQMPKMEAGELFIGEDAVSHVLGEIKKSVWRGR